MTILERLKTETRPQHEQIERVSFGDKIMNGSLSLDEYRTLIINNYKIHWNLENRLAGMEEVTGIEGLNFNGRRKSGLLEKDLVQLGLNPADYRNAEIEVPLDNKYDALGAYYVMEGSTLGGSVISRALAKNPNLAGKVEFNFYGCYGEMVGPMWKQFCQVLLNEGSEPAHQDRMVASAGRTFDAMTELFTAVNSNQV